MVVEESVHSACTRQEGEPQRSELERVWTARDAGRAALRRHCTQVVCSSALLAHELHKQRPFPAPPILPEFSAPPIGLSH